MRSFDKGRAPGFQDAAYFLQEFFRIIQVLDDMFGKDLVQAVIVEGIRVLVEIVDHIGMAVLIDIHAYCPGDFIAPTTDI